MAKPTKRKNGSYLLRVFLGRDGNGKQNFRTKTWMPASGMTELQQEKEALRQQFLFEEECKAGAFTTSGNIKFQALAEQWFREAAGKTNRPLSLQRLHTYEKRTYAAIGHLRVDKINTRTVQLFIDNLSEEGVSEKTLHALPKEVEGETVLRKVLRERGLAQNALAKQAGPSGSTVSSACRGESVTLQTAESIASALGMKLENLFTPRDDEKACLAPKTIRNYLSFISDVTKYAIRLGIIANNPCPNVILPPLPDDEKKIYTEEEAQAFLESLEDAPPKYRAFCVLAIYSGLRRGELLGLEWKDLDFDNCILSIHQTLQYTKEKGCYLAPPKTKKSARVLHLPSEVFAILRRYKAIQAEERLSLGDQWVDGDFLFTTWNGRPMAPNTPYIWLKRFCKRTGQRFYGVHTFRHLNASLLINCGTDVLTVSRALGHSQSSTTLNIYAHTFSTAQAKASEAIANALPLKPGKGQKKQSC